MTSYISFSAASKARGMVGPYLRFLLLRQAESHASVPDFAGYAYGGKSFSDYYREQIMPELIPFEDHRQAKLKSLRMRGELMVLGLALLLVGCLLITKNGYLSGRNIEGLLKMFLLVAIVLVGWATAPILLYRQEVKEVIFPRILRFFGQDFRYFAEPQGNISSGKGWNRFFSLGSPDVSMDAMLREYGTKDYSQPQSMAIRLQDFQPSGLVPKHDRSDEEDIVIGSHAGVQIAMLESRQYVKGDRSERLVFHGLFLRLSMNKRFHGHTLVRADKGLFNWTQSKQNSGLRKVALEDPRFEKLFEVYGSDQIEARYLLTPSMMERLQELGALFEQPKGIEAAFYDNHLLLKIPLKDNRWFEGGDVFTPVTFEEDVRVIFEQMKIIFKLIELLRLHEQTRL